MKYNSCDFKDLEGHTIISAEGFEVGSREIIFNCEDGSKFRMHHYQDCCEGVDVNDIVGDIDELIGATVLSAEESENCDHLERKNGPLLHEDDSFTWTFYKIRTSKGYIDIRWLGESNGWYSESVCFEKMENKN